MLSRSDFEYGSYRLYVTDNSENDSCSIIIRGGEYQARSLRKKNRVHSIAFFVITSINVLSTTPLYYFVSPEIQDQTLIIKTTSTPLDSVILDLMTVYGLFLRSTQPIHGISMNDRYVNLQSINSLTPKPTPSILSITNQRRHTRSISEDVEFSTPRPGHRRNSSSDSSFPTSNSNIS